MKWFEILPGIATMRAHLPTPGAATAHTRSFTQGQGEKACLLLLSVHFVEKRGCVCEVNCHYMSKSLENND